MIHSLNTVNLVHHGVTFKRTLTVEAFNSGNARFNVHVLVVVRLIHKHRVDTKIIKRNITNVLGHILLELFHNLHYRRSFSVDICLGIKVCTRFIQHFHLGFIKFFIITLGKRKHIKAAVCNEDRIEVFLNDFFESGCSFLEAEVAIVYYENIRIGIELVEHFHPLRHNVVGDNVKIFLALAESAKLHSCRDHRVGFSRTNVVSEQGVGGHNDSCNRVLLMLFELDFGVHIGELQKVSVKHTLTDISVATAVSSLQASLALFIAPYP